MNLADFKTIFWPEFIHRLLGRAIGIIFMLPLLAFAARKSVSRRFGFRLTGIFLLGGVQGLIGWLMVKSGLIDTPQVSQVRLALHLGVAFTLLALILWAIMDITRDTISDESSANIIPFPKAPRRLGRNAMTWYIGWFFLLSFQVILGAFMAGTHAGLAYNTWPDMNGQFIPDGILSMRPWHMNFLANITTIQFMHRKFAVLLVLGFAFWWYSHRLYVSKNQLGKACFCIALILGMQFALGVLTLLNMVPLPLALAHQMTALALFTVAVVILHALAVPNVRKTYDDKLQRFFSSEYRSSQS